jgi:type II secretory pathway pseudopilin PulG
LRPLPSSHPRGGFFLIDAIFAMGIILLLTAVLTIAMTRQRRAADRMADTRDAVRLAERTLTALQTHRPAPAPPEGSAIEIRPLGAAKPAHGLAWVAVRVTHRGRSTELVGIAPAAPSRTSAPSMPAAPTTAPATREGGPR